MATKRKNNLKKEIGNKIFSSWFVILPLLFSRKMWKRFMAGIVISVIPSACLAALILFLAGIVAVLQSKGVIQKNVFADDLPKILLVFSVFTVLGGFLVMSGAKNFFIILEMTILLPVSILVFSPIIFSPLIIYFCFSESCSSFYFAIQNLKSFDSLLTLNIALVGITFSGIIPIYIYISNRKNVFTVALHHKDFLFNDGRYFFSFFMVNESKKVRSVKRVFLLINNSKIVEVKNYGDRYEFFLPNKPVDFKVERNLFTDGKKYYKIEKHSVPFLMVLLEMEDGYHLGMATLDNLVNSKILFSKNKKDRIKENDFLTIAAEEQGEKTQDLLNISKSRKIFLGNMLFKWLDKIIINWVYGLKF